MRRVASLPSPSFPRRRETKARGDNKPKQPTDPLSLDGRGIKGEGEQDSTNHQSPSPLTREDQSLSQCLTREQRVKTTKHPHVIADSIRNPEGWWVTRVNKPKQPIPSVRHTGFKAVSTGQGTQQDNSNRHRPVIPA